MKLAPTQVESRAFWEAKFRVPPSHFRVQKLPLPPEKIKLKPEGMNIAP
jgi:hypothetical protein